MNKRQIEQLVKAGAEWLDKIKPNWWKNIDVELLDTTDTKRCVCGQAGVWSEANKVENYMNLGFDFEFSYRWEAEHKIATEAWRNLIKSRQGKFTSNSDV